MAYNVGDRFPRPPYPYRLLEPGSYQGEATLTKPNKAPFLSNAQRVTQAGNCLWTHAIYHADKHQKIPNCTTMMSKKPRFPYEALSKEDIEAILCRCGLSNVCECSGENEHEIESFCDAKIYRRLYKGPPPRPESGLSIPSRRDHGFEAMSDGTYRRIYKMESDQGPPLYDSEVIESTAFYRGCKWSHWRSTRASKGPEKGPGPADYNIMRLPTYDEMCAEKVREQKRKHSKQLRYIEMVQQRDILEQRPGPATYSPNYSKDLEPRRTGPQAQRFNDSANTPGPGPTAYSIKRDFDLPAKPTTLCHARLPEPSFFGVKAKRFRAQKGVGPGPAAYSTSSKQRRVNCSQPPFGSSAQRFKATVFESEDENETDNEDEAQEQCPKLTWEFKSKTIRMKQLRKKLFEQSPADLPLKGFCPKRNSRLQYICPFSSSEGRFQPWYDWLPVLGRLKTPGPAYYNLEKYRCIPAVCKGPLVRAERFPVRGYQGPAPNEYNVGGGLETILATHNQRLKNNLENQHKFHWEPPPEPIQLSYAERETIIMEKAIASLDVGMDCEPKTDDVKEILETSKQADVTSNSIKPKLLRYFLYNHPTKQGF